MVGSWREAHAEPRRSFFGLTVHRVASNSWHQAHAVTVEA
jgi:hypothetical protein